MPISVIGASVGIKKDLFRAMSYSRLAANVLNFRSGFSMHSAVSAGKKLGKIGKTVVTHL